MASYFTRESLQWFNTQLTHAIRPVPQTTDKKVKAAFGWLATRGRHSRLLCKYDLADFTQPQRGFVSLAGIKPAAIAQEVI